VPDLAIYGWDRIPHDASGEIADNFVELPDVAVGILSPDQSANTLVRRCLWYVAYRVGAALLVDPVDGSVLVFRPDEPVIAWAGSNRPE
jgi:Uma2 family endonuclease